MNIALLILNIVAWGLVLFLGFLVLGALRALGLLTWRVEQLETVTPSRIGRDGLKLGKKAPDFTLPSVAHGDVSLRDFAGRKVLLVFTQSGCGPCHDIAPELNRLHDRGEHLVLVVNNGEAEETRKWAAEAGARFRVLTQEKFSLSKRYEAFATPFGFLIDEQGLIASKGIVGTRQYLGYVLSGAGQRAQKHHVEPEHDSAVERATVNAHPSREMAHA